MKKANTYIDKNGIVHVTTPINLDGSSRNADWIHMDAVDMNLDTKEKLMAWLKQKGWTLAQYKKTPEWDRLVKTFPYARGL